MLIFSSPEQRSRIAIVLPLASINVKVFAKAFKISFILSYHRFDLVWLYILIQTFAQCHAHHPRSCQGLRLKIFRLKIYAKVFRTLLFFYLIDKRKFRWAFLSGDRSCYRDMWSLQGYFSYFLLKNWLWEPLKIATMKSKNKNKYHKLLSDKCHS